MLVHIILNRYIKRGRTTLVTHRDRYIDFTIYRDIKSHNHIMVVLQLSSYCFHISGAFTMVLPSLVLTSVLVLSPSLFFP